MKKNLVWVAILFAISITDSSCNKKVHSWQDSHVVNRVDVLDSSLFNLVQKQTFQYFYDGAEPVSGLARERFHSDNIYPENDKNVVTSGGAGFGVMALLVGVERGFVTKEEGRKQLEKIVSFLERADRFHGAWPHWWNGETGKVKPFSTNDNGGDLVETSFMVQGLIAARQYYQNGNAAEKALAARADKLWKEVEFDWYRNGQNVLYWHWSPDKGWKMNFKVRGYNECMIMYILAASSPTHGVPAEVYHEGWAKSGKINTDFSLYNHPIKLAHNGEKNNVGPLFWAQYSYLGLNPKGLKDRYADYWHENTNHTLINYDYAIENPKNFKGYGPNSWGLTASYSVKGYAAHSPANDVGVITPTAALSSYPYTPKETTQ